MLQKLFKSLKFENIKKLNLLFNIFKKMFVTLLLMKKINITSSQDIIMFASQDIIMFGWHE